MTPRKQKRPKHESVTHDSPHGDPSCNAHNIRTHANTPARFTQGRIFTFSILLISIAALLLYANAINTPFQFDDHPYIVNNQYIKDLSNLDAIFNVGNPKRPLLMLTYAINYHLGGLNPVSYHVVNIALHALNGLLVYFVVFMILRHFLHDQNQHKIRTNLTALLSSLLFICHPINTESVTYIWGRSGVLCTFFQLLALLTFILFSISHQTGVTSTKRSRHLFAYVWLLISVLFFLAALATKTTAITLPFTILLLDFYFISRGYSLKRLIKWILLFFLYLSVVLVRFFADSALRDEIRKSLVNIFFHSAERPGELDLFSNLLTQSYATLYYLKLLILPINQNADHDFPASHHITEVPVILSMAFLFAFFVAARWLFNRNKLSSFCIVWFLLSLSIFFFKPLPDYLVERRMYVPSICFSITLSHLMTALVFSSKKHHVTRIIKVSTAGILIIVLVFYTIQTVKRNTVYRDSCTFWEDVAEKSPAKARVHINLGTSYAHQNRHEEAIRAFQKADSLETNNEKTLYNIGVSYKEIGLYEDALSALKEVVALSPEHIKAHSTMASIYYDSGNWRRASMKFKRLIAMDVDDEKIRNELGYSYYKLKKLDKAKLELEKALSYNSRFVPALNNLGLVLIMQNQLNPAKDKFEKAIDIDPSFAQAYNNLGMIYIKTEEVDKATFSFAKAVELDPEYAIAHRNLALAYASQGKYALADHHAKIAKKSGLALPPEITKLIEANVK